MEPLWWDVESKLNIKKTDHLLEQGDEAFRLDELLDYSLTEEGCSDLLSLDEACDELIVLLVAEGLL